MTKYGLSDDVPEWLLRLKPGHYTLSQLEKLTGANRQTIYMRLESIGVEKKREQSDEVHWSNIYKWEGAIFYLSRNLEAKKKIVLKGRKVGAA